MGATGDIIWKWHDPKTVELYNEPPPPEPQTQPQEQPQEQPTAAGASDREMALMAEMMQAQPSYKDATPKQKQMWRRQIRDFWSEADDPRADHNQGIQSLIDSGAIRYDEDGLWVAQPNMGNKKAGRMIQMADAWADRVGLWRPDESGKQQFDPSNYQPYVSEQLRMQREQRANEYQTLWKVPE